MFSNTNFNKSLFKSTLDEVRNADLLLHVIDITGCNYLREKKVMCHDYVNRTMLSK